MFVISGATGHVGGSTCLALRKAGKPVRALIRDAGKGERLREMGCEIVVADLLDSAALAQAFAGADAVQMIVPLSPQAQDPAGHMTLSSASMISALQEARPPRVLMISDYGAHLEQNIGMPSVFHEIESRLRRLDGQKVFLRSAEHMQNWARSLTAALETGVLPSFQNPVDRLQPTISAIDLGQIAAELLSRNGVAKEVEVVHAEGPQRYSSSDVAAASSELLGRAIRAQPVPRGQWAMVLGKAMPPRLADLLIRTNDAKNMGGLVDVEPGSHAVLYGTTKLIDALRPLLPPR